MITNLFSVFDPRSAIMSFNWTILILIISFTVLPIWKIRNLRKMGQKKILDVFNKEVTFTLKKRESGLTSLIMTVFLLILLMNFLALYPQVFSLTSHLVITLPISLMFWMGIVMFGWIKNTNHILAHLVPQGTPAALMSFIVIIEIIRNLIRPITLCVRLTANLIAGHLLISLLGNSLIAVRKYAAIAGGAIPLVLTILESAVACIQAYVFITLITLYATEVKYDKKIQPLSPSRCKPLTPPSLKRSPILSDSGSIDSKQN